jgi:hypothetical protein
LLIPAYPMLWPSSKLFESRPGRSGSRRRTPHTGAACTEAGAVWSPDSSKTGRFREAECEQRASGRRTVGQSADSLRSTGTYPWWACPGFVESPQIGAEDDRRRFYVKPTRSSLSVPKHDSMAAFSQHLPLRDMLTIMAVCSHLLR